MITLTGLTDRQTQLCDMLWACDTDEDILELALALPPVEREQLAVLQEMMLQEAVEEELSLMERYPDAEEMLERLKKDYL